MDLQKAYKDIQSGAIKINRYQKRPSSQKQEKINTNNYSPRDDDEQFNLVIEPYGYNSNFISLN